MACWKTWMPGLQPRVFALALPLVALPCLTGCLTFVTQLLEPDIYGGVRYNIDIHKRVVREKKWHWTPLLVLDFPGSLIADTVFLPLTLATRATRGAALELPADEEEYVLLVRSRWWAEGPVQHLSFELKDGTGSWERIHVYGYGSSSTPRESGVKSSRIGGPPRPSSKEPILAIRRGDDAREAIEVVRRLAQDYREGDESRTDAANGYRLWPGPNSNTFVDRVARQTPHLAFEASHLAVGKDYARFVRAGLTTTKTGFEIETPILGVQVGLREGVELHLLQLTFGVSLFPPALKVPFQSRLGFSLRGMPEPRTINSTEKS